MLKRFTLIQTISFLVLGTLFVFPTFSFSHPHGFIEMRIAPLVKDQFLLGFNMYWVFDKPSSAPVIYELKTQKNTAKIRQQIMDNIIGSHYYSYFYDQQHQPIKYTTHPQNVGLKVNQRALEFFFDFYLTEPQRLQNNTLTLYTYDPSYYIAMFYQSNQSINKKALPEHCQMKLQEPNVTQSLRDYALGLDKYGDEDLSLGKQFAQKLVMTCR